MTDRTYPFTAWVLGGTFIPKEISLVEKSHYSEYHIDKKGKYHFEGNLFETKEDAIKRGHELLVDQEARMEKARSVIAKKRANLEKNV
jgi:hypothetical protein